MTLRALTLRQPWHWYVAHGPKRIENRTWRPPANLIGQHLAIHAGKALVLDEIADAAEGVQDNPGIARGSIESCKIRDLPRSAIVCVVRVVGFVTESSDPWFCGPFGWQLDDVVTLAEPVPCRGAQGLWPVPPDVLATVRERWRAARRRALAVPTADASGDGYAHCPEHGTRLDSRGKCGNCSGPFATFIDDPDPMP